MCAFAWAGACDGSKGAANVDDAGPGGEGGGGGGGGGGQDGSTGGDGGGGLDAGPDSAHPCSTVDVRAFDSKTLTAGGETEQAFADAYNLELAQTAAGPLLIVMNGVNAVDASAQYMEFGPAWPIDAGVVGFGEPPVVLPFSKTPGYGFEVDASATSFVLRFGTAGAPEDIPIVEVHALGTMGQACAFEVDVWRMTIPVSAAGLSFHGSTIGALMGAAATDGGTVSGWALDLGGGSSGIVFGGVRPADAGGGG